MALKDPARAKSDANGGFWAYDAFANAAASHQDSKVAREALEPLLTEVGAAGLEVDEKIGKVSLVGAGMKTNPGVAARMFTALSEAGVNIDMISTSTIRISVVVDEADVEIAVNAIHSEFGLDGAEVVSVEGA